MTTTMPLVTIDDVRAARKLIDGVTVTTPVEASRVLSSRVGGDVRLKCENLQRTGSFKMRGAYTRIARLTDEERSRGVVCASAGNHAQGVALAAQMQDVDATVFMPVTAPLPKVAATEGYGATIQMHGEVFDEALSAAKEFAENQGRVFVHPFDHPDIVAGQGTLGLELFEQVPDIGTVLVPIGGGGLISGVAVALRALCPDVEIIGVQAAGAASFPAALDAGEAIALERMDTICDGIAVKQPGVVTLRHVEQLVDRVLTVDDTQTAAAVVLLMERAKLVVEPSGAVGVAALMHLDLDLDETRPVVAVLSGGNIDPMVLQHLVTSGLTSQGRYVTIRSRVPDRPGELVQLLRLLGESRANVVGIEHHRLGRRLRLGQVEVTIELEVRGQDHIAAIRKMMERAGYPVTIR